ncbi:MAG TPA: hypothetical protein VK191_00230 [Symbiobacteriaceae bacterium]|nr:hypothetical protein [Symbiobacteriaceae bacterium]
MQALSHLLDRAAYYLDNKNWEGALKLAWIALEQADGDWAMASRAHLTLAEVSLAMGEPVDALNFTLGAQATALAAGDTTTQETAHRLQTAIVERWGDWPAKELAADYERLLSQGGAVTLAGDD